MSCLPCIQDRVRKLEPAWLGAAAAVGGLGLAIFKDHRLLAGAIGAAAVIALGIWRQGHCDCGGAAAAADAGDAPSSSSSAFAAEPDKDDPVRMSVEQAFTDPAASLRTATPRACA